MSVPLFRIHIESPADPTEPAAVLQQQVQPAVGEPARPATARAGVVGTGVRPRRARPPTHPAEEEDAGLLPGSGRGGGGGRRHHRRDVLARADVRKGGAEGGGEGEAGRPEQADRLIERGGGRGGGRKTI